MARGIKEAVAVFESVERWLSPQLLTGQVGCTRMADGSVQLKFRVLAVTQSRAGSIASRTATSMAESRQDMAVAFHARKLRPLGHVPPDKLCDFEIAFKFKRKVR